MLWIGTYDAKGGRGLVPLQPDGSSLRQGEADSRIVNASFGAWCERTRTAYFVDEQEIGGVAAWSRNDRQWQPRGSAGSGGALPCYLALDPTGHFLAVANYGDGSLASIELGPESGRIVGIVDIVRHSGRGPNPERQEGPHVHCAVFDEEGSSLYAVDLGPDRVFRYRFANGRLTRPELAFEAPLASGPRHLLLHPNGRHALLLTELSAEIMLLERSGNELRLLDRTSSAPAREPAENTGGHLALGHDGRILVSNRGHDSIASFAIEGDRLAMAGWRPTGGSSPRHFAVEHGRLIVAHEDSGDVTVMPLPDGQDEPRRKLDIPGAAFAITIPD